MLKFDTNMIDCNCKVLKAVKNHLKDKTVKKIDIWKIADDIYGNFKNTKKGGDLRGIASVINTSKYSKYWLTA